MAFSQSVHKSFYIVVLIIVAGLVTAAEGTCQQTQDSTPPAQAAQSEAAPAPQSETAPAQQPKTPAQPQDTQAQTHTTTPLPPKEEPGVPAPGKTAEGEDTHVLGVLPNYRTAEMSSVGHPLTPGRKLVIASKDSFDYPLFIIGMGYAALYQLENSHPEFGQGLKGYGRRLGTSYADQVIGNFLTEGVMPILFKEDPRYFRMAQGRYSKRFLYAVSRILITRTDAGRPIFNFSEIIGNGMASGIGLAYYPDDRSPTSYLQNFGVQLATDASSQVLKEFWPDIKRWRYARHHKSIQ